MNRGVVIPTSGWLLIIALVALGLPAHAGAATTRHSGTVLAIDKVAGTIVLGEFGPWRGGAEPARRTVFLVPSTEVRQARRASGAGPSGWVGEFVETPVRAQELKTGDFVTVEVRHEGSRTYAIEVTVVPPSEP